MADYGMRNAPPPKVLTYNVTNERGWNDPPTSVFSPNATGNRKRIDPRKARVGHNINSTAGFIGKPTTSLNGAFQSSAMNGLSQNFQGMCFQPMPSNLHHTNSNPDLYNMLNVDSPGHPSSPIHHSASVPNKINTVGQYNNLICGGATGTATPPPSVSNSPPVMNGYPNGNVTPPQSISPPQSMTPPPSNTPNRKLSAPSAIMDSTILTKLGTPTMLQSSHLVKPTPKTSNIMNTATSNGFQFGGTQPVIQSNCVNNVVHSQDVSLHSQNHAPQMSSLPPMPASDYISNQNNLYARSVSSPGIPQRLSPTNVSVGPPPTTGFYSSSSRGSPKSASPGNSGHNSPIPSTDKLNDSQLLNDILKRLNDCREKCLCHLSNKMSDDISKRVVSFGQSWISGKLSTAVKLKMSLLSEALDEREFSRADSIHKSLILEYSKEVMPWMVGIKKLISSYQQAVLENNKFQ